jgi:hypothetical protein
VNLNPMSDTVKALAIGTVAVLLPASLLYPDGTGFARDWLNHVWMVGYTGEYFRQHLAFPVVYNTETVAGGASPVFYGYLFYPLLGLFATHLNAEYVVRAAAVVALALQYAAVRRTVLRLGGSTRTATCVAALTIWSTYGLTNLYNRAALTEFFAIAALTCAVCEWFDLLRAESRRDVWRLGLRFGLNLTLAMGFHPITGLYALPMLPVLALALPGRRASLKQLAAVCTVAATASALVLAPWVFAVATLSNKLDMAKHTAKISTGPIFDTLDCWQTRLNPLPTDARCYEAGPNEVSTPYLDAQISWPLLILGSGVAYRALRSVTGSERYKLVALLLVPVGYGLVMLFLSLTPAAFDHLPNSFKAVQFLYRIVSFVNLAALLLILFALALVAQRGTAERPLTVPATFLAVAATYGSVCVLLKLQHAQTAVLPEATVIQVLGGHDPVYQQNPGHRRLVRTDTDRAQLVQVAGMCGLIAYGTPNLLPQMETDSGAPALHLPFGLETRGGYFGEAHRITATAEQPTYLATPVLVFPWNRFLVDGEPVPVERLRAWNGAGKMTAVPIPAGTHTVQYVVEPNRTWLRLHRVSQRVLVAWVLALAVLSLRARRANRTAEVPVADDEPAAPPLRVAASVPNSRSTASNSHARVRVRPVAPRQRDRRVPRRSRARGRRPRPGRQHDRTTARRRAPGR